SGGLSHDRRHDGRGSAVRPDVDGRGVADRATLAGAVGVGEELETPVDVILGLRHHVDESGSQRRPFRGSTTAGVPANGDPDPAVWTGGVTILVGHVLV